MPGPLETHLRARRDAGHKLVVPYITGGYPEWMDAVRSAVAHGADAVEVGIPFSDPVMDGPVLEHAAQKALELGTTPPSVFDGIRQLEVGVPIAVMCYYNTVFHAGHERFAQQAAASGVAGVIVPDLPLEESGPWCEAADAAGVDTVMLAAPTAPDERLPRIVARARGFVYSVGLLGVTGERDRLASSALSLVRRLKPLTDVPVLVGVGVSNAAQAAEVCSVADGAVQGASVMRRMIEGGPEAVGAYVAEIREAVDAVAPIR